jgi:ribosomal protein L11 methyltransferase
MILMIGLLVLLFGPTTSPAAEEELFYDDGGEAEDEKREDDTDGDAHGRLSSSDGVWAVAGTSYGIVATCPEKTGLHFPGESGYGAGSGGQREEVVTMGRIFRTFRVGAFTVIPEGEPSTAADGIPLVMGRKGAFGSGEHETTAACLGMLERHPGLAGTDLLDLGSGTGILAIAALLLGGGRAVALDIEWPAAESCRCNALLNGVDDRIDIVCGELASLGGATFDLVLANIYADILLPLAHQLVAHTRPGGRIVLSGIPLQDKFDVWRRYTGLGCRELDAVIGEEFVTYLLERTPS